MESEDQYMWKLARLWGGVLVYTLTLGAGLINSYNSGEFAALNIVIPVLLLVAAVSIAVLGYARDKGEVE